MTYKIAIVLQITFAASTCDRLTEIGRATEQPKKALLARQAKHREIQEKCDRLLAKNGELQAAIRRLGDIKVLYAR